MLRTVLAPPPHVRLEHIAAIQERHLAVGLDPHLVSGVRGDHVQRRDVQPEFACLGELAQTGAERQEVGSCDRARQVGELERHVVDPRRVQAEDVPGGVRGGWVGRRRNQVAEGAAGVICEFGEEGLRFGFGERAHFGYSGWAGDEGMATSFKGLKEYQILRNKF